MSVSTGFRYHTEFIKGHEVEKPLPKKLHAIIQKFLLFWLEQNLPQAYESLAELSVICSAERIVPDVTVFLHTAQFIDGDLVSPPALAIEISSPKQNFLDLLEKCESLLAAGAAMCWIIDPEKRQAWMFSQGGLTDATRTLDVILGTPTTPASALSLPLDAMWSKLDRA